MTTGANAAHLHLCHTSFLVEKKIAKLCFIKLGLFQDDEVRVTTTVSAVLIDTRSGYIHGLTEATSHQTQLVNNWTSQAAIDQFRRRAEQEAFENSLRGYTLWMGVTLSYAPRSRSRQKARITQSTRSDLTE